MGRTVTVLDWTDIQSLVRICTLSFPADGMDPGLETLRHSVMDSFVPFFQQWQPGQLMDDELRRPLVESLEHLADALVSQRVAGRGSPSSVEQDPSLTEIATECTRIAKLVRSAMAGEDEGGGSGPKTPVLASILVFLASQGEALAAGLNLAARVKAG